MKNLILKATLVTSILLFAGCQQQPNTPKETSNTTWKKVPDVAQYTRANWDGMVKTVSSISLEEAKEIASKDASIDYFFYAKGVPMVLTQGTFKKGDAVFFSGKPVYGKAKNLSDIYLKIKN